MRCESTEQYHSASKNPPWLYSLNVRTELIPYSDQLPGEMHRVFLRKIAEQLAKDLYPLFEQDIPDFPSPGWIFQHLHASVERIITERSSSLSQLLYRIDLSEKKINELMAQTATDERIRVLSEQILEREAKKVWMRMHYSSR